MNRLDSYAPHCRVWYWISRSCIHTSGSRGIICYQRSLGGKQVHHAMHWPRFHGPAASADVWGILRLALSYEPFRVGRTTFSFYLVLERTFAYTHVCCAVKRQLEMGSVHRVVYLFTSQQMLVANYSTWCQRYLVWAACPRPYLTAWLSHNSNADWKRRRSVWLTGVIWLRTRDCLGC